MKVSRWRFVDTSGNSKTVVGEHDTFKQALVRAMNRTHGPSTAFDLKIEAHLVKGGRSFWKEIHGREITRVFEELED